MGSHDKTSGIVFWLFVLIWGIIWLGNEMTWWAMNFPFWPVLVIVIALGFLFKAIKKSMS